MERLVTKAIFVFFLLFGSVVFSVTPPFFLTFIPPHGWHLANLSQLKESGIKVGFIKSTKDFFAPTITLSLEAVKDMDLATYVATVKQHYHNNHTSRCHMLGSLHTSLGDTTLLRIDLEIEEEKTSVFQAISLYAYHAIIQTATCLRKDFLTMYEIFLSVFCSISVYPSLIESLDNPNVQAKIEAFYRQWEKYVASCNEEKTTLFVTPFFQENQWKPLVNFIEKECKAQGPCWQFLALRYIQESCLQD